MASAAHSARSQATVHELNGDRFVKLSGLFVAEKPSFNLKLNRFDCDECRSAGSWESRLLRRTARLRSMIAICVRSLDEPDDQWPLYVPVRPTECGLRLALFFCLKGL